MSTDLSTGSTTDPNAKGWTVMLVFGKHHRADTYAPVNTAHYSPMLYANASPVNQKKFGQMTQEEAVAMAKLLNASTTD